MSQITGMDKSEQQIFVDKIVEIMSFSIKKYSIKNGHEAGNLHKTDTDLEEAKRDLVDFLEKATQ